MARFTIDCNDIEKRRVKAAAASAGETLSDYYLPTILNRADFTMSEGDIIEQLVKSQNRCAELEAELATIQEKCGADFEKVQFVEDCSICKHDTPGVTGPCGLGDGRCIFEAVKND